MQQKWHSSSAMTFISTLSSETWVTCWLSLYFDESNPTGLYCMLCGLWPMISYKWFKGSHHLALIPRPRSSDTQPPNHTLTICIESQCCFSITENYIKISFRGMFAKYLTFNQYDFSKLLLKFWTKNWFDFSQTNATSKKQYQYIWFHA